MRLTACRSGNAGAGQDDDAAGPARVDEIGNSGEAAFRQSLRRGVLADQDRRLLLAHLALVPFPFPSCVLGFRVSLPPLDSEVVKNFKLVWAVVLLLSLERARPSSVPAAYLSDVAAVPV